MDDAMCTAGSSSAGCGETTVSCPIPQNRPPIWKRHIFPDSPAANGDPFELPSNLTPALRRVKSRAKLPAKGSTFTQSLSKLPTTSQCSSSTLGLVPSLRTSPRKKASSLSQAEGCSDVFLEKGIAKGVNGVVAREEVSTAFTKPAAQTPTRARNCLYPVSLPPKKPRLSSALMSSSDLRPARKPVMVEPDYELPPPCATPSRLSKALRHSSVNLSVTFGKEADAEVSAGNGLVENTVLPDKPPRMFHSRSTMCLRLTPDRDMRERRRSGAENSAAPAPFDSPKKKLQHSRTVSDLQQLSTMPVRRGRRISLSDANSKELPPKPLRKRSSSLDLVRSRTAVSSLCDKKRENKSKQQKQKDMVDSSQSSAEISVTQPVGNPFDTPDLQEKAGLGTTKYAGDESEHGQSEDSNVRPTVITEKICNANPIEDAPAPPSEMVSDNEVQSTVINEASATAPPSEECASKPAVDGASSSTEVVTEDAKEEGGNTSGAEEEDEEQDLLLTALLPSDVDEAVEIKQDSRSKEVEPYFQNAEIDQAVESSDPHVQSEDTRGGENFVEQNTYETEVRTECLCSVEASSSTSACPSEGVSHASTTADEVKGLGSTTRVAQSPASKATKSTLSPNKRVNFRNVTVYYFARTQGMSTVPKSGEVSLGMVDKHFTKRHFPLYHGRRPELTLPDHEEEDLSEGEDPGDVYDPEGLERCTAHQLPLFEGKARIKLLKKSGVQVQKDTVESLESIRQSRILCGCQCEGMCKPETCQCALDGIGCQVDGPDEFGRSHPCSCTSANCLNPAGRVEFDPEHVKNHYRITMMRLHHAEQKGIYDSPQRIRFNSEGEPQSVSHLTPPPVRAPPVNGSLSCGQESLTVVSTDDPPTRKFPVTPVYKKAKQKRGLRVQLAGDPERTALLKIGTKLSWREQSSEPVKDQELITNDVSQN